MNKKEMFDKLSDIVEDLKDMKFLLYEDGEEGAAQDIEDAVESLDNVLAVLEDEE
jgi:hypothetical protein